MISLSLAVVPAKVLVDGTHKIRVAINHKHETRYIATRFIVQNIKQFKNGRVVGRDDAVIINKKLRTLLDEYQNALDRINTDAYTCGQLREYLSRYKSSGTTISQRWQEYIDELREEGRDGTAGLHELSKRYFSEKFSDVMLFETLSPNTIIDFEKFLRSKKRLGDTTISMHMKRFKAIINAAKKENIVKYEIDPFAFYNMPESAIRELDITIEEFNKIRNCNPKEKPLKMARDIFILSYYLGGINLIDLMNTNFKNMEILEYIRAKTKHTKRGEKRISITIPDEAKSIIRNWIDKKGRLNFDYNYSYANFRNYVTKQIQRLANILGINKRVVYYSARKSFVQHGYELNISLELLEYCTGQSVKKNRPIFNYVKFMRKHADETIRKIIDHVNDVDKWEKLEYILTNAINAFYKMNV
ncbi:site-specific integrase [Bacteroides sp.]|uniref:site-specific integrase n=1 Tax=Bacteroides sp. TaxID=29523 RepID=UPI0026122456|nr:site-specific integrase [Bacteroides sp.]MDD3038247.1 site-specific integrase [Bacteroides sp.]